jgi:hypothetical protein
MKVVIAYFAISMRTPISFGMPYSASSWRIFILPGDFSLHVLNPYHAIHNILTQAYLAQLIGYLTRNLNPLAALISAIVGSKSTQRKS